MPDPFADEIEQLRALCGGEGRRLDALRRDHLAVLARPEHQIADLDAEQRLLLLLGVSAFINANALSFSSPSGRIVWPSSVKLAGCAPVCVGVSTCRRPAKVTLTAR